jgi:hypothetical protein
VTPSFAGSLRFALPGRGGRRSFYDFLGLAANAQLALPGHCLDLRNFFTQLAELFDSVVLAQRHLEAQPEQLFRRRLLVVRQLVVAQIANLLEFHCFLSSQLFRFRRYQA